MAAKDVAKTEVEMELITEVKNRKYSAELGVVHPIGHYIKDIVSLALPNTLIYLAWTLQNMIGLYFVGSFGNTKLLGGASLGLSWTGIFGFSFVIGLSSALDTLVSQSFGERNYRMCGIYLNRGLTVVSVFTFPCYILLLVSGTMLRRIGIDPEIADFCSQYTLYMIPAVMLYVPLALLEKFLLAQRIATPQMYIQGVNTLLYYLYCYLFVHTFHLGFLGTCAARAFSEVIYIAGMLLYMYFSQSCSSTFVWPSMEAFKGWSHYLSLALPTMFMVCLEMWGYEITSVAAGFISPAALASATIGMNICMCIYITCVGIGVATGTYVGNSIGEKNTLNAKKYAVIGVVVTIGIIVVLDFFVLFLRSSIAGLFSADPVVISCVEKLMYLVAIHMALDGPQGTLGRILIGVGRQSLASLINLFSYYGVMIPVALLAAFKFKMGVYGIWLGYIVASLVVSASYTFGLFKQNWASLVAEAEARNMLAAE